MVSGKFDVCGMQDKLGMSLANQGMVKILHTSRYYPSSGIVANKSVPDEVLQKVRQAMIDAIPETSGYSSVRGTAQLRSAAADYLARRFHVEVDPARV